MYGGGNQMKKHKRILQPPEPDPNLVPITGLEPRRWCVRKPDLQYNIDEVRREFVGQPEICHKLVEHIIYLRRYVDVHTHWPEFQNIVKKYLIAIKNCKSFKTAYPYKLKNSCYWLFSLKTKHRDRFIKHLKSKKISSGVHLMPLPLHPLYKKYNKNIKNSLRVWKELVTLPCFPDMKNQEVNYIINTIKVFDKQLTKND